MRFDGNKFLLPAVIAGMPFHQLPCDTPLANRIESRTTAPAGHFEIGFWTATNPDLRILRFAACDPIVIESLPPFGIIDLSKYPRTLKSQMPAGRLSIGCTVGARDEVQEILKWDNTATTGPLTIEP
jgi:hypothetical protein